VILKALWCRQILTCTGHANTRLVELAPITHSSVPIILMNFLTRARQCLPGLV